ncbi:hypothetical protein [Bacteroides sp. 519]|uniref:hypothetical protein n=1 Tax=Bacteroides sp. 519 TaxID=2302937 RepID=UPI0013D61067|nr:hypothetical protein [Bacteroides sp. 519]
MTYTELQTRKAQLIAFIEEEVYNEQQLLKYETMLMGFEGGVMPHQISPNYPYSPSEEKLKSIVTQAIEDDKNGSFIDGAEFEKKLYERRKREETLSL